jgi:DNA invertase Pin-like site-specific DNA recombinase
MKDTLHIYCRVSTGVQETEGTSLESQQELGKLKAKQLGMSYKIWSEGAKSSDHDEIEKREKLSALLTAIDDGTVKHLYVTEQSRLARTDNIASMIRYQCNKKQVKLYIRDTIYDFTSPMDTLTVQIMSAFSQFENAIRKERSRLGKLQKVKRGYWHGGEPPYGYELKSHKEGNKLAVNKKEAKWVKQIFEHYSKEHSIKSIQTMLRKNYVLARRGKTFSTGSLNALIKNRHYIGQYHFTDNVSNETITVPCPTIVNKSLWNACNEKVQSILKAKNLLNRVKRFVLLREFLWCGHCGNTIGAKVNEKLNQNYYYCPRKERKWKDSSNGYFDEPSNTNQTKDERWKRGRHCSMTKSLNINIANEKVFNIVSEIASKSNILKEQIKSEMMTAKNNDDKQFKEQLRILNREIKRQQKELSELNDVKGKIETDRLMKRVSQSEAKQVKLNIDKEIKELQTSLDGNLQKLDLHTQRGRWVDWVSQFKKTYATPVALNEQQKYDYLKGLIKKIDVHLDLKNRDHTLDIQFNFPIVNDKFKYIDEKAVPKTYKVTKGKYSTKVTDVFNSKHYGQDKVRMKSAKKKQ